MPETDEAAQAQAVEQESATDESAVDWKAKAREWEKRAKDNMSRLKEAEPQLAEYNRLVEASKTDLERAQEEAKTFAERASRAERQALITQIALDKGLTAKQAKRLQGETPEELEADADELLSEFGTPNTTRSPAPDRSQGSSANGGAAGSPTQEFASLIQRMPG